MNGGQTRRPRPSASTERRRLLAISRDRLDALTFSGDVERQALWKKLNAGWHGCGWTTLYRNASSGTVVGLPIHCDQLLCPYCELRRVATVRDRYRTRHDAALEGRRLWFLVLTVPNVAPGRLAAELDRIRRAIVKLRRRSWWTREVLGGVWRLEVTINLRTRTWHPHANLLFETRSSIRLADWQPLLLAEWQAVLGDDAKRWIWLKPGWSGSLSETVKRQLQEAAGDTGQEQLERHGQTSIDYTVKPDPHWIDPSDPAWVVEYAEALAGRRAVSSFGAWRGLPEPEPEPHEELVSAPYVAGDDFFATRRLPALDPLTDERAEWEPHGWGPRWSLRPHRPAGDGRQEWLVWRPGDGQEPTDALDDTELTYQAALSLGPSP